VRKYISEEKTESEKKRGGKGKAVSRTLWPEKGKIMPKSNSEEKARRGGRINLVIVSLNPGSSSWRDKGKRGCTPIISRR